MTAPATSTMTRRERWVAALDLKPVDRLPVWPKLNGIYPTFQAEPFSSMSTEEIFQWLGCDRQMHVPPCYTSRRSKTSQEEETVEGERRVTYHTPAGDLVARWLWDEGSSSWHPVEFPVKGKEDIERLRLWHEDETWEFSPEGKEKALARAEEIGQDAGIATGLGVSPLMDWIEHEAGVEMGHYFLMDYPEEVGAAFEAAHRNMLRRAEIQAEHTPADMVYSTENTSTTLISPDQYERYCFKHLCDYGAALQAEGKRMVLHMCGLIKALLPLIDKVPARAFEAFTSPPVGNTTFVDGRGLCPEKCFIGGTNATLWTYPAEQIIAELDEHFRQLPHHRGLIVTSAGVMPPLASPETIKAVFDWVQSYPIKM